jgi:hypothetical protein
MEVAKPMLKAIVRGLLFVPSLFCGGMFYAEDGTLWCELLEWTYGEAVVEEPVWNVWWPEDRQ